MLTKTLIHGVPLIKQLCVSLFQRCRERRFMKTGAQQLSGKFAQNLLCVSNDAFGEFWMAIKKRWQ
jgi:hypothetical protein